MTELLQVKQLTRSFDGKKVVDGVTFSVAKGEAFGLLGPNGAGKSTTMMMICGIIPPDDGTVTLAGMALTGQKSDSRQQLGVVPQDLAIYPDLTARENLMFFGALYHLRPAQLKQRVDHVLDRVGLTARASDLAGSFSGGMKRRLNFAAAILHQPAVLILDEPTVGVDPHSRSHLLDCVRELRDQGTAILYCSHYMEEVEAVCTSAAIMDHGKILTAGSMEQLLRRIPGEVEVTVPPDAAPDALAQIAADGLNENRDGTGQVLHFRDTEFRAEPGTSGALSIRVASAIRQLAEAQIPVLAIRTLEPNLERLFLELTGSSLRD
ncbi:MAG: ABC transporter ATP-binding protein [Planctomycetaceae bacterium]|nr:ABC transporter ATP-binding protein [Planctomycetaceae bacterium]